MAHTRPHLQQLLDGHTISTSNISLCAVSYDLLHRKCGFARKNISYTTLLSKHSQPFHVGARNLVVRCCTYTEQSRGAREPPDFC